MLMMILCSLVFGPYVYLPAEYAQILSVLLVLFFVTPVAAAFFMKYQFKNGHIRCPRCQGPFVDPRTDSMLVGVNCCCCGYSILVGEEAAQF